MNLTMTVAACVAAWLIVGFVGILAMAYVEGDDHEAPVWVVGFAIMGPILLFVAWIRSIALKPSAFGRLYERCGRAGKERRK